MSERISRRGGPGGDRVAAVWGAAAAIVLCLIAAVWLGLYSPRTGEEEAALQQQQIEAIKDFASSALRSGDADFIVAVGAAIPQGVALRDMPRALGDALPAYINDQYVVLTNRFIIVARRTRRIIAVVPTG